METTQESNAVTPSTEDEIVTVPAEMTQEEIAVYNHLSDAYNDFIRLPVLYDYDQADFAVLINQIKNILLARVGMRSMGVEYSTTPQMTMYQLHRSPMKVKVEDADGSTE